jgi:MFS family permease
MVGSTFLIGIVIGCSFVTKMGDTYGRRPIYALGLFINFAIVIVVIFSKIFYVSFVCLFLLGVSITARYYVGYTYNIEF